MEVKPKLNTTVPLPRRGKLPSSVRKKKRGKRQFSKNSFKSSTLQTHEILLLRQAQAKATERAVLYKNQQLHDGRYCVLERLDIDCVGDDPYYTPVETADPVPEPVSDGGSEGYVFSDSSSEDLELDPKLLADEEISKDVFVTNYKTCVFGNESKDPEMGQPFTTPANKMFNHVADDYASRFHMEIRYAQERFYVLDMGSKNGTFVQKPHDTLSRPVDSVFKMTLRIGHLDVVISHAASSGLTRPEGDENDSLEEKVQMATWTDSVDLDGIDFEQLAMVEDVAEDVKQAGFTVTFNTRDNQGHRTTYLNTDADTREEQRETITLQVGAAGIVFGTNAHLSQEHDDATYVQLHPDSHGTQHHMQVRLCVKENRFIATDMYHSCPPAQTHQRFWTRVTSTSYQTLGEGDLIRWGASVFQVIGLMFRALNKEQTTNTTSLDDDAGLYDFDAPYQMPEEKQMAIYGAAGKALDCNFTHDKNEEMQDRCVVITEVPQVNADSTEIQGFFAVFDGHAGRRVADYAATALYQNFVRSLCPAAAEAMAANSPKDHVMGLLRGEEDNKSRPISASLRSTGRVSIASPPSFDSPVKAARETLLQMRRRARLRSASLGGDEELQQIFLASRNQILEQVEDEDVKQPPVPLFRSESLLKTCNIRAALEASLSTTTRQIIGMGSDGKHHGSTAVVAVLTEERGENVLYGYNLGDSRALIVSGDGTCVQLTRDHSTKSQSEVDRVKNTRNYSKGQAKNVILNGRLGYCLRVTRSLGDRAVLGYGLSDEPHNFTRAILPEDRFLVLASDGVLADDMVTNTECAMLLLASDPTNDSTALAMKVLSAAQRKPACNDNMCVIVVRLNQKTQPAVSETAT